MRCSESGYHAPVAIDATLWAGTLSVACLAKKPRPVHTC